MAGGVHAANVIWVEALHAARRTVPPDALFAALFMACVVTVITASPMAGVAFRPLVITVATYLVPEAAIDCSQPQPLETIVVPDEAD